MPLPDGVAVKLDLYTLACRELLNRLPDLHTVTQADSRLDCETCLERFDEAMHVFFERANTNNLNQAVEQFGNLLHAQAGLFHNSNQHAAEIFDDLVSAIHKQAPHWSYRADLERFHIQGRELARHFFATSPWPETQRRLSCECDLAFRYGAPDDGDRVATFAEPFGYRAAPLAYYANYWDEEREQNRPDVVLARFTFGHDFILYLAYPFLFLHEYTAHVYATDYENERFNDGWMLHAAAAFLKEKWNKAPGQVELNWAQAGVFHERLLERLKGIRHGTCLLVWRLDDLLYSQSPLATSRLPDTYTSYEIGLRQLLNQIGNKHPHSADAIVYQQRLVENIDQSRRYGDTETRRADRSEIIYRLNEIVRDVKLGASFNELCDQVSSPKRFVQITYELAAFQPGSGENDYWPTQVINALEIEYIRDPERLLRKIQASSSVRELMTTLSPA
jgi:hypothetical protein